MSLAVTGHGHYRKTHITFISINLERVEIDPNTFLKEHGIIAGLSVPKSYRRSLDLRCESL